MEFLIKVKNYLVDTGMIFWGSLSDNYWPHYYGWLTQRLASYDPFMVLTLATSFALFFLVLYYWARNRQ